jgi:DNA-binding MarR family transcriptional regulator
MPIKQSPAYLLHKLVLTMDRAADELLRDRYQLSYNRAYFLFTLERLGTVSQRRLADALGYSAASVSTMLRELLKAGYVDIQPDLGHKKRKLVSLTPIGQQAVTDGTALLDAHFSKVMEQAAIDVDLYALASEKLYKTLTTKADGEK